MKWKYSLDNIFFSYRVGLEHRPRSRRLHVLHWAIKFLVLCYVVLFVFVFDHKYLTYEDVTFGAAWFTPPGGRAIGTAADMPYCTHNEQYNFLPGPENPLAAGWQYSNFTCGDIDETEVVPGQSCGMFRVMTHRSLVPPGCANMSCRINQFVKAPENVTMVFVHGVASLKSSEAALAVTQVLDQKGKVARVFKKGEFVVLPIGEVLSLSGLSLDDVNFIPAFGTTQVRYRLSGVKITVILSYSNYRRFDLSSEMKCNMKFLRVKSAWGYTGPEWQISGLGPTRPATAPWRADAQYVTLQFQPIGKLGYFDFFEMVVTLLSAVVLFGVASKCVTFAALYFFKMDDIVQAKDAPIDIPITDSTVTDTQLSAMEFSSIPRSPIEQKDMYGPSAQVPKIGLDRFP